VVSLKSSRVFVQLVQNRFCRPQTPLGASSPSITTATYSLLTGPASLPQMVERALELVCRPLALTDHGVMYGAIRAAEALHHRRASQPNQIGTRCNVDQTGSVDVRSRRRNCRYHPGGAGQERPRPLNRNLGQAHQASATCVACAAGAIFFAAPCSTSSLLRQYSEGLSWPPPAWALRSPQAILKGRPDVARECGRFYQELSATTSNLEIPDHGSPKTDRQTARSWRIAAELGIELIATMTPLPHRPRRGGPRALLCVLTGKFGERRQNAWRYNGTEYIKK